MPVIEVDVRQCPFQIAPVAFAASFAFAGSFGTVAYVVVGEYYR
jgi:hypothetical protein